MKHTYHVVDTKDGTTTGHDPLVFSVAEEVRRAYVGGTHHWHYLRRDDGKIINTAREFAEELALETQH